MAVAETTVTVNVADLPITKELVLASAEVLRWLEDEVDLNTSAPTNNPFFRFRNAVLAFAARDAHD